MSILIKQSQQELTHVSNLIIQWLKFLRIQEGSFLILTCMSADLIKSFNVYLSTFMQVVQTSTLFTILSYSSFRDNVLFNDT